MVGCVADITNKLILKKKRKTNLKSPQKGDHTRILNSNGRVKESQRERQRDRETERQRGKDRDRDRDGETEG